jgi:hypothetical protein
MVVCPDVQLAEAIPEGDGDIENLRELLSCSQGDGQEVRMIRMLLSISCCTLRPTVAVLKPVVSFVKEDFVPVYSPPTVLQKWKRTVKSTNSR